MIDWQTMGLFVLWLSGVVLPIVVIVGVIVLVWRRVRR